MKDDTRLIARLQADVEARGPMHPTLHDMLVEVQFRTVEGLAKHLEMFAAAYYCATDVPPEEAVLVQQIGADGTTCWWFERKPAGVPKVSGG